MVARSNKFGAFDAKTHFSELLDRVERGEEITITRHGIPVARLVPAPSRDEAEIARAIASLKAMRTHCSLGGLSWKDLRDEGRR
ncbi:MAG TPA: type II toxin-antitoxin system prevent-host-death family antitoxin [Phycisphaerales bacterium]|nr:type II toxin-antitoxin system prevent-host-death family antitoxin [Phycisphaerales bacterium]